MKVKTIIAKTEALKALGDKAYTKANIDAYNENKAEADQIKYQQVIFSENVNLTDISDDTNYIFRACLYNIKDANFTQNLSAVSYLEIDGVAMQHTKTVVANLWDVANTDKTDLEKVYGENVEESAEAAEYKFVSGLCKTYNVTVTSGLDSSKEQTITVQHGQKLDAYIESLSTVTANVVGSAYFDCFVDSEDAVYSDIVTSDLTLTAKYSTIAYGYDATKDVYYVADNKAFKGDTVIIPATYNDGVHEEKAVKYVADSAFETNTNIKKVLLNESVVVVGRSSFHGCTSLTYMAMPGVQAVAYGAGYYGYKDGYEKITTGGINTFLNAPIETLIVNSQFEVQGQQFASNIGQELRIRVYSLSTTPAEWTGDRASNCVLRTGENSGFDKSFEAPYTSPVCYYSEEMPTDTAFAFWKYDENGEVYIWTEYAKAPDLVDDNNVVYGWDEDDSCYYVAYSPNVTVENLVIPEKFDDGVHGEAYVKYIASVRVGGADKGAFQGNTNLKSVVLPDSVVSLNGSAFSDCSNLEYVVMRGVTKLFFNQVNRDYNSAGAIPSFTATQAASEKVSDLGLNSMYGMYKGYNFTGCTSLKYLVVGDGFQDLSKKGSSNGRQNFDDTVNIKVYVYGTKLASMQADNLGTFTILTYSETDLMDGLAHWYYDESGAIKEWPVLNMKDEQGVAYGYDTAKDCYYVADNKALTTAKITIPATFNDGVRGEKAVKYVADNAFTGNTSITHVNLNESVVVIGSSAFSGCTSLEFMSMPGVKAVAYEYRYAGYSDRYTNVTPAEGTFADTGLKTLIVPDGFEAQGRQFYSGNADRKNIIRVYSLATTPAEWKTDRASNCILRTGASVNNAFIDDSATTGKSPVYYYSASEPADTNYTFWCYNEDGSIKVWGAVAE